MTDRDNYVGEIKSEEVVAALRDFAQAGQYGNVDQWLEYHSSKLEGLISPVDKLDLQIEAREAYGISASIYEKICSHGSVANFETELAQLKQSKQDLLNESSKPTL